jgi:hypothetical protein
VLRDEFDTEYRRRPSPRDCPGGRRRHREVFQFNLANRRASLGIKQMTDDPWNGAERTYPPCATVDGSFAIGQPPRSRVLEVDAAARR